MNKIIILGHTGYVGRSIFNFLSSTFKSVTINGFSREKLDLRKKENFDILENNCDSETILIVCAAIKSDNGNSIHTFHDNVLIAENIVSMLERCPVKKVILFSSNAVYSVFKAHEILSENTTLEPDTFYGLAKFVTEKLFLFSFQPKALEKLVILRPSTIYGPNEPIVPHTPSGFLNTYINGGEVTLWGDGSELREFVFIDDLVKIISIIIKSDFSGVLNIGSGNPRSYKDALDIISKLLNKNIVINSKPRTKKPVNKIYDLTLFHNQFPDFTFTSLEKGLELTYKRTI